LKMAADYLSDKREADGQRVPCTEYVSGTYRAYYLG
jgi:hypothetical protein